MKFHKNPKTIIYVSIGIVIIILIPWLFDSLIFGNNIKSNLSNGEWAGFLGSYIGGIVGGFATLSAVLISLNKGKTIQEESEIRENVLIVYYDLILGLTDLKKIYISHRNQSFKDVPTRMFLSSNWIRNVAMIASKLENIDYIYKLYGDLEMLRDDLKTLNELDSIGESVMFQGTRYKEFIDKLSKRVFCDDFLNQDMIKYVSVNEQIELNIDKDLDNMCNKVMSDIKKLKEKSMKAE
ncbi:MULTISPECIES: hypothetical protein [unclassified Dehalobacter]|uniref:hypothetical protein n=1 Tax=unclassified Dehalobacter TaxID=2635733 RepID=UPI000E6B7985|nr:MULTISPECIES: hypothetical protein [unclassified Dehalobacter]RJE48911.1 hypothetical protein A7K50_09215 [Dehalobacter sp. MCB1]TCX52075.1 hypothetical protein C1I36_07100 [Dehalobacter sp. 14DCB1]TCX53148.1 hypothetical protein C1I38_08865 [Dehalobacter sp. 12DCB1]